MIEEMKEKAEKKSTGMIRDLIDLRDLKEESIK
jgi:hypothetical protein